MLKIKIDERVDNTTDVMIAHLSTRISFCGIPIYSKELTTSNNNVVNSILPINSKRTKVKGFRNYETENKG